MSDMINDSSRNSCILVVDDAMENLELLRMLLDDDGYETYSASNGRLALEMVEQVRPDLILLDIMMPVMDGFETCKRLKESPETSDIPVIFLTAQIGLDDIVRGFELGALDYVTKPFNPTELLARVKTHIQLKTVQHKLEELADKLAKYLSPQVYESIFKGEKDVKIESYEKTLTVCFSDIVDFMPRVESMTAQELTNWLNHYLNEMAEIVIQHGGTLDKYIGDAIMVFFGDPSSLGPKEDAIQCVRMAKDMLFHAKLLGVDVRIGINTGECTVGNFGSADRMDYTIIGKEVNVASRLETEAQPGRILISEFTHDLIKEDIQCEPRGEIHVKGIARPLMTYWVVV